MSAAPIITRAQIYAAAHMTLDQAVEHFGVSRKYLLDRSGQCCMRFKGQGEDRALPAVLTRRCACGRLFECHDVLHERTCPGCLEEMAA